jgi:3-dehydroquinate dehydratase-1
MTPPTDTSAPAPWLVGVVSRPEAVARFAEGAAGGSLVDLLEVRVDLFDTQAFDACAESCARVEAGGTPVLVTIRSASEGGRWTRPDADRLPLYRAALEAASWVDVEGASPIARDVVAAARARGRHVILSHHDFQRTPPLAQLERAVADALAAGADIAKVATLVASDADRDALFRLLASHLGRACVIGMGDTSAQLRTELPARGSRLAYAYVDAPTAPGQLSVADMDGRLRAVSPAYAAKRPATA